jgi:hypothetical protein
LKYLQDYKDDFDLERFIQHNCKVTQLTVLSDTESSVQTPEGEVWPKIRLEWQSDSRKCCQDFDAVCICNGHYSRPSTPSLPGMQYFQGTTLHSIAYDDPKVFQNQTVLCIGGRASGSDLARELALYAKHVYLSDSTAEQVETQDNITCVPRTVGIDKDGRAQFDKCPVTPQVDYIIFCTGYDYDFTFINKQSHLNLTVGDRRVMPLYKQLWHAEFPNVCFVGLPHSVLPFPLFELQLEAVVEQWIQGGKIPALLERFRQAQRDAMEGGVLRSGRIQDTHFLGGAQWDYCREMAKIADLYDEHVENYISTNRVSAILLFIVALKDEAFFVHIYMRLPFQTIYEHSQSVRSSFPPAPDTYREYNYARNDEQQSFYFLSK